MAPEWLTGPCFPSPAPEQGVEGLDAILAHPDQTLVAFDYDGTLSPIVDDPSRAHPEPEVIDGLAELSGHVDLVAVITGRPAQLAVDLAGFAHTPGLEDLVVIGHYGMERWDACSGELGTVEPPSGRGRRQGQAARPARIARSGRRRDRGQGPVGGGARPQPGRRQPTPSTPMVQPLRELAESAGLVAEPGRKVVELRPTGYGQGAGPARAGPRDPGERGDVRRRRPRRPGGLRCGRRAARRGHPRAARLLGIQRGRGSSPPAPTSWSTARGESPSWSASWSTRSPGIARLSGRAQLPVKMTVSRSNCIGATAGLSRSMRSTLASCWASALSSGG